MCSFLFQKQIKTPRRPERKVLHLSLFPLCMFLSFQSLLANANCLLDEINIKGKDGKRERMRERGAEGAANHFLMEQEAQGRISPLS